VVYVNAVQNNNFTEDSTQGTGMVNWNASVGSLLWSIPTYNFSITFQPTEGLNETSLISQGENLIIGFRDFESTLYAQGPFNNEDMSLNELLVKLGIDFVSTGEGDLFLNGNNGSWSLVADSIDSLFQAVWNECNAPVPVINNYVKCVINVAVEVREYFLR